MTILNHYWIKWNSDHSFSSSIFNPFTLKSDQYLISPYNITPWISHESQQNEGNVHQIKKPKNFKTNSPCQHLRNSIETSKEIIHTDVRVNTVLIQQSKHLHLFCRDVWKMYLERGEFELAKEYCRVMLNMVTVLVVQNGFVFSADAICEN